MTIDTGAIKRAVALRFSLGRVVRLREDEPRWTSQGSLFLNSAELNDIIAALTALAPVAEGKAVIVPVEPTESMIAAGIGVRHLQGTPEAWSVATVNIYRAMIGARM